MDALALVECQRITAVLESGVEKLGILASLTTDLHNEVPEILTPPPRAGIGGHFADLRAGSALVDSCDVFP